jgi:hypothetical protein
VDILSLLQLNLKLYVISKKRCVTLLTTMMRQSRSQKSHIHARRITSFLMVARSLSETRDSSVLKFSSHPKTLVTSLRESTSTATIQYQSATLTFVKTSSKTLSCQEVQPYSKVWASVCGRSSTNLLPLLIKLRFSPHPNANTLSGSVVPSSPRSPPSRPCG